MKTNLFLCALTALLLTLASCADPDKIHVEGVDVQGFQLVSTSAATIDVGLEVTNESGHKAAVTGARAEIHMDGTKIAEITLRDKVVVPKHSEGVYTLPFSVRVNGLMGLMALGSLNAKALDRYTVNAKVTLRGGWAKKSFEVNDMPLATLLRQLGLDPQNFLNNYNFDW